MYTIAKTFAFSASHIIAGLPPEHPCGRLHGHNYEVEVILQAVALDGVGFVRDYRELSTLKDFLDATVDHNHLNDVLGLEKTTAEALCKWLYDWCKSRWPEVVAVRVAANLGGISAVTERIRISEIFGPTIQGEGPLIGRPTVFVRTAGCDYRCSWCDTLYAVLPEYREEWSHMTPSEVLARVNVLAANRPLLISLSGGNPALQPLDSLITLGHRSGHSFAMETQGSVAQQWFAYLDWLILSPKPPSSGMTTDWNALGACVEAAGGRPRCILKIVIFDEADYDFARTAASHCPKLKIYLQVGNPEPLRTAGKAMPETADILDLMRRLRWLVDRTVTDRWFDVTVLPQLHVLAWGNKRGF